MLGAGVVTRRSGARRRRCCGRLRGRAPAPPPGRARSRLPRRRCCRQAHHHWTSGRPRAAGGAPAAAGCGRCGHCGHLPPALLLRPRLLRRTATTAATARARRRRWGAASGSASASASAPTSREAVSAEGTGPNTQPACETLRRPLAVVAFADGWPTTQQAGRSSSSAGRCRRCS